MATQIDISDPRTARALEVLATSGQWAKVVTRSGAKFYGVPSQREATRRYLTNALECDCEDQKRHPELACKHRQAVRMHCAYVRGIRQASSKPTLNEMEEKFWGRFEGK